MKDSPLHAPTQPSEAGFTATSNLWMVYWVSNQLTNDPSACKENRPIQVQVSNSLMLDSLPENIQPTGPKVWFRLYCFLNISERFSFYIHLYILFHIYIYLFYLPLLIFLCIYLYSNTYHFGQ